MFPALRLGFVVIPDAVKTRLLPLRQIADGWGAPVPQYALAEFIGEGHLRRYVRRMQRVYAVRRRLLLEGLREHLGHRVVFLPSRAGLHFSIRIPGRTGWDRISKQANALDVAFERCSRYSPSDAASDCYAIGFGLLHERDARDAAVRLAAIFE